MLILSGYAVRWNTLSSIIDKEDDPFYDVLNEPYYEKISPNAFKDSLNNNNQLVLIDHNFSREIGKASDYSLMLLEDDTGLKFQLQVKEDSLGISTFLKVLSLEITGVSIGFNPIEYVYEKIDGKNIRSIYKANLVEISLTNKPLYPLTSVMKGNKKQFLLSQIDKLIHQH
ncbi:MULTISPECIES: HK97 family phage prohead protease [Lactococcus]|uniref:HK97 family phage prohead protease n=1 Tax=Lactococcus TaxID=1357 RepID=UPI000266C9FA|nr:MULTISPECIES: HK97 family phage prohead protease [Lactococcus]MDN5630114.1 HK97 family phage prohead protease [Lactococcus sp.]USI70182.1 HK97 family phage prohead protease [Lactococcus garvieae subsp. garvieae]EIT67248.1 Phage protease [Lactococcus garvieae IPLA 31405]MBS4463946.1 HK97 family phage prohead protease [Lactococcus garvieae]MCH1723737.1 HK97 family phage prohead protease [Lactococcus formosensis]